MYGINGDGINGNGINGISGDFSDPFLAWALFENSGDPLFYNLFKEMEKDETPPLD